MKLRVVHFSDWHGNQKRLPDADLYVCTGDMLNDYFLPRYDPMQPQRKLVVGYRNDPKVSGRCQRGWIKKNSDYRKVLGIEGKPVVCVRGNHEFTDLAPLFGGPVWEVDMDSSRTTTVCGLRVGGCRGVPDRFGLWSDEFDDFGQGEDSMEALVGAIPDIDLLITHVPPLGILDNAWGNHIGSKALASMLNRRSVAGEPLPRLHCFGHVHGSAGVVPGSITFSNAATTVNVLEVEL